MNTLKVSASLLTFGIVIPTAALFALPAWLILMLTSLLAAWLQVTELGRQAWAVTRNSLSTLPQRYGPSSVIVIGIAGAVAVFVALLAMAEGFDNVFKQTGDDRTAIVVSAGSQSESSSLLTRDTVASIMQAPQIARSGDSSPTASAEITVVASLPTRSGEVAQFTMRGVSSAAWKLRSRARIIEGRSFEPGLYELIVGNSARGEVAAAVGSTLTIEARLWTVVGVFDSGDAHNSELWTDHEMMASAFRRGANRSSLTLLLNNPSNLDSLRVALASDPHMDVDVLTTQQFYGRQAAGLLQTIRNLAFVVGAIMAMGAMFGALNCMYTAVATRERETATLRAIGFRPVPVMVSVMLEAALLALLGGVLGAAIVWLTFDGFSASTLANSSRQIFSFEVSPSLLWEGIKWALTIGLVGGAFPALRAVRMPIASGLREL